MIKTIDSFKEELLKIECSRELKSKVLTYVEKQLPIRGELEKIDSSILRSLSDAEKLLEEHKITFYFSVSPIGQQYVTLDNELKELVSSICKEAGIKDEDYEVYSNPIIMLLIQYGIPIMNIDDATHPGWQHSAIC